MEVLLAIVVLALVVGPFVWLCAATKPKPVRAPFMKLARPVVVPVRQDWAKGSIFSIGSTSEIIAIEGLELADEMAAFGLPLTTRAAQYMARHGVAARTFLTITRPEHADWIIFMLGDRIAGKVVVEIGAGNGILALALARRAKHVYAIEAYPPWAARFATESALDKPANLTWILDRAENLEGLIRADIAVVVTGSDVDHLRELAGRFAPDVAMPWQDWNDGQAVIRS